MSFIRMTTCIYLRLITQIQVTVRFRLRDLKEIQVLQDLKGLLETLKVLKEIKVTQGRLALLPMRLQSLEAFLVARRSGLFL